MTERGGGEAPMSLRAGREARMTLGERPEWFLLVVELIAAVDLISVPIGSRVPQREHISLFGPLASEAAARQAGRDLLKGNSKRRVVMFAGVQITQVEGDK